MNTSTQYLVAVIGAGPAGLFAARELATQNVDVTLINRDIKPGGLAEYGIYPEKHRMKEGLRAQFRQILALDAIHYYGNLKVGERSNLKLSDLQSLGFGAILVTVGAQSTKWLGLPGENLDGVYHAKDLVYHYNRLPPFSQQEFHIGRRVAIIGAGNVMLDIARYLSSLPQVEEINAIIRRGPAEIKFGRAELEYIVKLLDQQDLNAEMLRVDPIMRALAQKPEDFMEFVHQASGRACNSTSKASFRLRFLVSPTRIVDNGHGKISGLELEENSLVLENGEVKAYSLGTCHTLPVDTVIFAIGDRVDGSFGIPVQGSEYAKNPTPQFPMDGNSYEAFDPKNNCPLPGIFVAGWSRKASSGLVGVARKDGVSGARAVLQYLQQSVVPTSLSPDQVWHYLHKISPLLVTQTDLARLEAVERERAQQMGLEDFKFGSDQEMLEAVGLLPEARPG
jgi:ferredoxin--NADP+ reductase